MAQEAPRYERKAVSPHDRLELEWSLRTNPAMFTPLHQPRAINNIYFDTADLKLLHDAVHGSAERIKVRLRWYGEDGRSIVAPTLEIKSKHGWVGTKHLYPVAAFPPQDAADPRLLGRLADAAGVPPGVCSVFPLLRPVLVNRYRRAYFLSANGQLRACVDWDLQFHSPVGFAVGRRAAVVANQRIVELKYPVSAEDSARLALQALGLRIFRISKYVAGMDLLGAGG